MNRLANVRCRLSKIIVLYNDTIDIEYSISLNDTNKRENA